MGLPAFRASRVATTRHTPYMKGNGHALLASAIVGDRGLVTVTRSGAWTMAVACPMRVRIPSCPSSGTLTLWRHGKPPCKGSAT